MGDRPLHFGKYFFETNYSNPQGMTSIAKIEIVIPIPIFIRNWDRDPDLNLEIICDPIAIAAPAIADLLGDL